MERDLVALLKDCGLKAVRAWGSNGQALGEHEEVDVLMENTVKIQVKARASIADYIRPTEHVDFNIVKQDRDRFLLCIYLPKDKGKLYQLLSSIKDILT